MAAHPEKSYVYGLLRAARKRAAERGIPCTLTVADVEELIDAFPQCPGCGVTLVRGSGRVQPDSPTLDRVIPDRGYVPGNVIRLCFRCNILKRGLTPAQMIELGQMAERIIEASQRWPTAKERAECMHHDPEQTRNSLAANADGRHV
jgi:hypothetical protein